MADEAPEITIHTFQDVTTGRWRFTAYTSKGRAVHVEIDGYDTADEAFAAAREMFPDGVEADVVLPDV